MVMEPIPSLFGVVENYTQGMTAAGSDPAYAMPQGDPITAPCALHGPLADWEYHPIATAQGHYLGARLHTWPLFRQHEFPACEIPARLRQQEGRLQGKNVFAVKILMEAIVIPLAVLQQQGCRLRLAGLVAPVEEGLVIIRIPRFNSHGRVPAIGDPGKGWIQGSAQAGDGFGKRMSEVFVLAPPKAVARHHNTAAEPPVLFV